MLQRIAQSAIVVLVAAVCWFLAARWAPPAPAAALIGLIAAGLILRILIRPITLESWESFWETVSDLARW